MAGKPCERLTIIRVHHSCLVGPPATAHMRCFLLEVSARMASARFVRERDELRSSPHQMKLGLALLSAPLFLQEVGEIGRGQIIGLSTARILHLVFMPQFMLRDISCFFWALRSAVRMSSRSRLSVQVRRFVCMFVAETRAMFL